MYGTAMFDFLLSVLILHFYFYLSELSRHGWKAHCWENYSSSQRFPRSWFDNKEICIQKGFKLPTVQELIPKFKDDGSKNLPFPQKPPHRTCKVHERTRTLLRRQLGINPSLTGCHIKEGNPNLLAGVSLCTIPNVLCPDLEYHSYRGNEKPLINDSQRNKRVQFAKKYQDWTLDKQRIVVWFGESTFCANGTTSTSVQVPRLCCSQWSPVQANLDIWSFALRYFTPTIALNFTHFFNYNGLRSLLPLPGWGHAWQGSRVEGNANRQTRVQIVMPPNMTASHITTLLIQFPSLTFKLVETYSLGVSVTFNLLCAFPYPSQGEKKDILQARKYHPPFSWWCFGYCLTIMESQFFFSGCQHL